MRQATLRLVCLSLLLPLLAACDRLGIPDPAKEAADREAEGRAIGGACRQSGRALEDCYTLNQKASKSAIFNGWREMNDYMMQNKIEVVKPEFPVPGLLVSKRNKETEAGDEHADGASEPAAEASGSASERRRARLAERRKRDAGDEAGKPAEKEKGGH
ncbi:MAG: hypothetical protein QM776_13370 [Rhodocyclaceae bacterium]